MPETKLWGVSTKGNVYNLSTDSCTWRQVSTQGQKLRGFKKIAATPDGAWGLGCDHQVFAYIEASDLPIRCQESTHENERWVITRGWSGNHLLPMDPWKWSNEEGDIHLPKEDFKLQSNYWKWESDWYVDENVHGFITDKGGWRYGTLDFHGNFSHQKTMKSCIRRRRWIRYRRFMAIDRWFRIPSIHVDPLEEPIVDLSIGGQDIPNQPRGFVSVWVTTVDGRVLHRTGVHQLCPEGVCWEEIPTGEDGGEVLSISVGQTGLVWAVTWQGELLIRVGVNWQNVKGTAWVLLQPPAPEHPIVEVAVGVRAVWAVTNRDQVWFRKGVNARGSGEETSATGTGWLEMVSKMKIVSMGPDDQVWGIDPDNRMIHFRTGVSVEELSGRRWKPLVLTYEQTTHGRSTTSLASVSSYHSDTRSTDECISISEPVDTETDESLKFDFAGLNSATAADGFTGMEKSGSSGSTLSPSSSQHDQTTGAKGGDFVSSDIMEKSTDSNVTLSAGDEKPRGKNRRRGSKDSASSNSDIDIVWDHGETPAVNSKPEPKQNMADVLKKSAKSLTKIKNLKDAKNLFSQVKGIGKEVNKQVKGIIHNVVKDETATPSSAELTTISFSKSGASSSTSGMKLEFNRKNSSLDESDSTDREADHGVLDAITGAAEPLHDRESLWSEDEEEDYRYRSLPDLADIQWLCISGMMCQVSDESSIRHWFTRPSSEEGGSYQVQRAAYHRSISVGGWRALVLSRLRQRNSAERESFPYESAIEKSCWTKKGSMKWWRDNHRNNKWVDCDVELSQDYDTKEKNGTVTLIYKYNKQQKHLLIQLSDIVCVCTITDSDANNMSVFGIYLQSRMSDSTKRLPPLKFGTSREEELEDWVSSLSVACCEHRALTGTPSAGSMWSITERGDIFVHEPNPYAPTELAPTLFWHQIGGHLEKVVTCKSGITWGVGHNKTAWVYTGGYGGGFFKGLATSHSGINTQSDERIFDVYENQRWRPVKGYTDRVILSDCYMWSDVTGQEERSKDGTKLLSKHWSWITDWMVDQNIPGGCDKEGWQYANSIKGPFTPRARFRSVLRRRRWIRKCQVVTSGPWSEVAPLALADISIQPDHRDEGPVIVWAIGENGDVVCRLGVTKANPQGQTWHHIPTDQPFTSVSVGSSYYIWATAKDGSVWLRNGVTETNIAGKNWTHVPPPKGIKLSSISVGMGQVWALDTNRILWFRQGISDSQPDGTHWVRIISAITQHSISPKNQVWIITKGVRQVGGDADGVLSRRAAIPDNDPKGGVWDHGIGGGWSWVCSRGWYK